MIINTQIVSVKECGSCQKDHDSVEFHGDGEGDPYIICPETDTRIALTDDNLPGAQGLAASVESLHNFCRHLDDKSTALGMAIFGDEENLAIDAELDDIDKKVSVNEMRNGKLVH